ncbi:MAG: hypothetical protein E5W60_14490 [Mesorhizobium sp.]|nr:MAG: hypothetical protein E5W60_14490 [Mesorhizobium sp.]
MIAVIIRIALRYGAAVLVARGLLGAGDAAALSGDPDIQMALEAGIGPQAQLAEMRGKMVEVFTELLRQALPWMAGALLIVAALVVWWLS